MNSLLLRNIAKHIRVNVQPDVSHVVKMLARHQPHDLADSAFRVVLPEPRKSLQHHILVARQLGVNVDIELASNSIVTGDPIQIQQVLFNLMLSQLADRTGVKGTASVIPTSRFLVPQPV